jgi:hypothetical protein
MQIMFKLKALNFSEKKTANIVTRIVLIEKLKY